MEFYGAAELSDAQGDPKYLSLSFFVESSGWVLSGNSCFGTANWQKVFGLGAFKQQVSPMPTSVSYAYEIRQSENLTATLFFQRDLDLG